MKKYLCWDVILGVVFFIDCIVVSIALVTSSYSAGDNPEWLIRAMRIMGFVGIIFFSSTFRIAIREWVEQKEWEWENEDEEDE